MSGASFDLHILILSEDSAGDALPSLRALTKSMLRLVDPHYQDKRVDLEPEGEEAQLASHANLWQGYRKSSASHKRLVTLSRTVARHVFAERGFVLYHNRELATQGFPARAVHGVGKSFHETVERLRSSPTLVAALAATHPGR